jgi:hypothetical protein
MSFKTGVLGAAASISLLVIGSRPQPAVAFACSTVQACPMGCKTTVGGSEAEGVHVCYSGCSYPPCKLTSPRATGPGVESLIQTAANGDIKAAVRLATSYGASVRYNEDRHALMYYSGCTGDFPIGVQPLSPEQSHAVAVALGIHAVAVATGS